MLYRQRCPQKLCVNQILLMKPHVCKLQGDGGVRITSLQFTVNLQMFTAARKGERGREGGREERKEEKNGGG